MAKYLINYSLLVILLINSSIVFSHPCNCYWATIGGTKTKICYECAAQDGTYTVPEPSTIVMLGIGVAGLAVARKYRSRKK
jgi:hypothetical protein